VSVIRAAIQPPSGQLTTEEVRQPKVVAVHCPAAILHERLKSPEFVFNHCRALASRNHR